MIKLINKELLNKVSAEAKCNERLRKNYNFHKDLNEPMHRLLNGVEPGTYIQPHRHKNPDKEEIFLVLRGELLVVLFEEDGTIREHHLVAPQKGVYGMEIAAGVWHTVVSLAPQTMIYEIKEGPYLPMSDHNLAKWAPSPQQKDEAQSYINELVSKTIGF